MKYLEKIALIVSIFIFSFAVLKNIAYPLMWGDEAETAVFAQRIIKYGYPKVHDSKNSLNLTMADDKSIGVREEIDAWIHLPWLQYYYAVPGVYLAENLSDLYQKTALVRLPFALIGILGILLIFKSVLNLFMTKNRYWYFGVFMILETLSVPLILNLREVRSYPLTIFLLGSVFLVFNSYYFFNKLGKIGFFILESILLLLILNNFTPAYLIIVVTFITFLLFEKIYSGYLSKKGKLESIAFESKTKFKTVLGILITSLLLSIPFNVFYKTFYISGRVADEFARTLPIYLDKVARIINFYLVGDLLILAVFIKVVLIYYLKKYVLINPILIKKVYKSFLVSSLFTIFIFVYVLVTANMPYIFDRYYIALQPVLVAGLLIDFSLIILILKKSLPKKNLTSSLLVLYFTSALLFLISLVPRFDLLTGYVYEMAIRYKGHLDYSIPYLYENYKNISDMTIETTIEQTPYIYYLGSSVFREGGYKGPPINAPDIIIPKKYPDLGFNKEVFDKTLSLGDYYKISFPVADYPVNNISEFTFSLRHQFKTRLPTSDNDRFVIYVNKKHVKK